MITVDVRVVAATNRDLEAEARAGRFREDLFYRLSVFPILVPPLRERPEDIAPLAQHFLERTCAELGRDPLRLSQSQAESLKRHRWSGNIRELKNVMMFKLRCIRARNSRRDDSCRSRRQALDCLRHAGCGHPGLGSELTAKDATRTVVARYPSH